MNLSSRNESGTGLIPGALSRRRMMQMAGLTAAAPLVSAVAVRAETTPKPDNGVDASTPQRKWAHQHLRGLLNLFLPTFKADMVTLDEEAIRHDVRHAVAQGFSGTLPLANWTLPHDPRWEEYHRIIIDEAAGKIPVHGIVFYDDAEKDKALLARMEKLGVEMVLLASRYDPDISAPDLYEAMASRINATELPVMLYAALNKGRNFPKLGPAGQPLDVYDRVADLPNVTSVKVSQPVTLTSTMQICETVADRLLVAPVNLDFMPLLARHYHMQWSGQWNGEAVQTPEKQLGNDLINACAAKDFVKADAAARAIQPVHDAFFELQASVIRIGAHPWQHNKYYSWLGGGNGGLLPMEGNAPKEFVPVLTPQARSDIRAAFAAAGLPMTGAPEEQFIIGRAAWERGVRPGDVSEWPRYEA